MRSPPLNAPPPVIEQGGAQAPNAKERYESREGDADACHRYHVERRAEDWGATQEEVRRHCSAVRNQKQTLRYRYHYTRTVHTLA